jgi:hypothetical protein
MSEYASSHSMPRPGMPSSIWRRSTTACGTVAGAPGSIRRAPRRARAPRVTAPTRSVWFATGKAHAALVFDRDVAVAWCEYGSPEELPNIYHRKEYNAGLDKAPDYRLTCFFVDRNYRRKASQPWRLMVPWI